MQVGIIGPLGPLPSSSRPTFQGTQRAFVWQVTLSQAFVLQSIKNGRGKNRLGNVLCSHGWCVHGTGNGVFAASVSRRGRAPLRNSFTSALSISLPLLHFQRRRSSELVGRRKLFLKIGDVANFWAELYRCYMHGLLFATCSTENSTYSNVGACLCLSLCHTRAWECVNWLFSPFFTVVLPVTYEAPTMHQALWWAFDLRFLYPSGKQVRSYFTAEVPETQLKYLILEGNGGSRTQTHTPMVSAHTW